MAAREPRRVDVAVTELADEGLGVGRLEDTQAGPRTVMVRNALPGEALVAVVRKRRRGIWFAEAVEHRVRAPERVSAPCSAYPRCAGCVLQHLDYDAQLAHKQARVLRLVAAQGVVPGRVRPAVSGPRFHYRRRARLGARIVDGRLLLGFREGFGNRIARIKECRTLATSLAQALPSLADALGSLSVADRIPQVELAAGDAEAAFVVRHLAPLSEADETALARFAAGGRRVVWVQPEGYDSLRPLGAGAVPRPLSYANPDFGVLYQFLPADFTQVNPTINRALVRSAVLALDIQPGEAVVDLFCGIGNFSLALARQGGRVFGCESGAGAVDRARRNAALNGLGSLAEFAVQDLYDASGAGIPAARLLLLDPPRSGAGPNLRRWVSSADLERIVYVSCNPETFATDAVVLQQQGFRLAELGVFDMFPQTAHIETLGLFIRSR